MMFHLRLKLNHNQIDLVIMTLRACMCNVERVSESIKLG
jgi:hypothetical protein